MQQLNFKFKMKTNSVKQINAIQKRANAKGVTIANRHFVIGGLSKINFQSNDINQFKLSKSPNNQYIVQWKPFKLSNKNIFTPRNSFAACGSKNKIYIYGGMVNKQTGPFTLRDFIQIDIMTNKVSNVEQKGELPPPLNSASLNYNQKQESLLLFGGTNDNNDIIHDLYKFNIKNGIWSRIKLELNNYKQAIWQHTALLSEKMFSIHENMITKISNQINPNKIIKLDLGFTQQSQPDLQNIKKVNLGQQLQITEKIQSLNIQQKQISQVQQKKFQQNYKGPFLIIVGGCSHPEIPYPYLTQIDLNTNKIISQISLIPMVGHDSIIYKDQIYIFGGSDGTGQIDTITIFGKQIRKEKGILAIGPISFATKEQLIIYGGINMQSVEPSFNGFWIYSD